MDASLVLIIPGPVIPIRKDLVGSGQGRPLSLADTRPPGEGPEWTGISILPLYPEECQEDPFRPKFLIIQEEDRRFLSYRLGVRGEQIA